MSHFKESLPKYTANYRCPDDVNNLTIRIKIDSADGNYGGFEETVFKWQQKVFGRGEMEFFKDERNCLTDLDKKYHLEVEHLQESVRKFDVFSYVNDDDFALPDNSDEIVTYLQGKMEKIEVDDGNREDSYDFRKSLTESTRNPVISNNFEVMYIMADLGEYVETTWIKYEQVLCTLKFDRNSRLLTVFPDFSKSDPYYLHVSGSQSKTYKYFIDNISNPIAEDDELRETELFKKITNQKAGILKQLTDLHFQTPPKSKLEVYLFFEILWGKNFENDSIFVQYSIDLPENWEISDQSQLRGQTQTCVAKNEDGTCHFGHSVEIVLNYDICQLQSGIPRCPYIYFEVISKDSWNRFRTEGLTYKHLPVAKPGSHRYDLQCFRLLPDSLPGRLRRFFVGDCFNYSDVTWIGAPIRDYHDGSVLNKFGTNTLGTGQLEVRVHVVHQSDAFLERFSEGKVKGRRDRELFEKLNSSTLVKSVEQVLAAFRRARRDMIEARKNI